MDDFGSLEEVIVASSLSSGSNLDADRKIRATKYSLRSLHNHMQVLHAETLS